MTAHRNDVDDLIASLREDLPSGQDEARVRKRLAGIGLFAGASGASLGAHAAQLEAEGQAIWSVSPKATVLGKILGLSGTTKAVIVAVGLGGGAWGLPRLLETKASGGPESGFEGTQEPVRSQVPAEPTVEIGEKVTEGSEPEPTVERSAKSVPVRATPKSSPTPTRASKPNAASELAEETRLMERAIAASQSGDRDTASRYLDLHAAQFPNGALSPERERLRSRL